LIACAERKPLRHRLNALAIARTDQSRHLKRAHLSPCWLDRYERRAAVRRLPGRYQHVELTYVNSSSKVTYMVKTQVYLRKEELDALRMAAARSGRSVAELIRDAIRKIVLKPQAAGPVAIWDGEPKRTSIEHDSVHDER
jgi:Ribbon-helix-helix protein, copG family